MGLHKYSSSSYPLSDPATPHPLMQVRGQRAIKEQFLEGNRSAGDEKYYHQHEAQTTAPIRCWGFSELHPCLSSAVFLRSLCCSSVCSQFVPGLVSSDKNPKYEVLT